jgi:hypothetical protein
MPPLQQAVNRCVQSFNPQKNMDTKSLNGKWSGEFKYKHISGLPLTQPVKFEILLNFTDNNFTGTCTDALTLKLFDEPASIIGTYADSYISFIKRYPCMVSSDENLNPILIRDEPSVDIHYTGILSKTFFTGKYVFNGEWSLTDIYFDENGNKIFQTSEGTWTMKKSN